MRWQTWNVLAVVALGGVGGEAAVLAQQTTVIQQERTTVQQQATPTQTDLQFLDFAGEYALRQQVLARAVREQSRDPAVRAYAGRMLDFHSRQTAQLQQLAAAYNRSVPTEVSELQPGAADRLRSTFDRLTVWSGERFDREYLNLIHTDQRQMLERYQAAAEGNADPQVRTFAAQSIGQLQQHQAQTETLSRRLASL